MRKGTHMIGVRPRRHYGRLAVWLMLAVILPAAGLAWGAGQLEYDADPIRYTTTPANDPIARLQQQMAQGRVKLKFDSQHGYLLSVLQQLKIPTSSQMLVFSKTSFQHDLISPETPRALYFNAQTYIGWVQGGSVLEVATVDPQLGAVFYVLPQVESGSPKFVRQTYECLQCHDSGMAGNVPGLMMRSVYPDRTGRPLLTQGTYVTTDQSPLRERWGGWYVTGKHGNQAHMGNMVARSETAPEETNWGSGGNVTDLKRLVDASPYLMKTSDIVALMVSEHQTHTQDLITRANYETRRAMKYQQDLNKELGRPADAEWESVRSRIQSVGEPLLQALLFSGEAPLTEPITGTSGYAEQFSVLGPHDRQGRTLYALDLRHRLFRYPCSYLIYSEAFDGLPAPMKDYLYRRLLEVLNGKDRTPPFAHLTDPDRQAILEILQQTKPDFAAWQAKQAPALLVLTGRGHLHPLCLPS